MKTRLIPIAATALTLSLVLSACSFSGTAEKPDATAQSKTLHVAYNGDIADLNPLTSSETTAISVLGNVMEGLYRLGEDQKPQPAMAESYKVSDDGLTYTFKLRDGITWSNGEPVTSEDFKDAWLMNMNAKTAGTYSYILTDYILNGEKYLAGTVDASKVGIQTPDNKTLVVELSKPTTYFLSLTAFMKYVPINKAFYDSVGTKFGSSPATLLYNGPYTMTDYKPAGGVILEKNKDYWDAQSVHTDTVDIKVIKEATTALTLYKAGKLDRAELSAEDAKMNKDNPEIHSAIEYRSYYVQFNLTKPAMANLNIRKAIQAAYNPKTLTDVVMANGSEPAYGLVPPGMSGLDGKSFRELQGDLTHPDAAAAKGLWEKGSKELGGAPKLELVLDDDSLSKDIGTFLQDQLKHTLGADISLVTKPYSARLAAGRAGEYQMLLSAWGADYDDAMTFLDLWSKPVALLRGSFSDSEYDKLIESAKNDADPATRIDSLLSAEKFLVEKEAVVAPVYYRGFKFLQKPDVKGISFHSWGNPYDYKYVTMGK